jgi:hypothetical protein
MSGAPANQGYSRSEEKEEEHLSNNGKRELTVPRAGTS